MALDCSWVDEEQVGDLLGGVGLGHELADLFLARLPWEGARKAVVKGVRRSRGTFGLTRRYRSYRRS